METTHPQCCLPMLVSPPSNQKRVRYVLLNKLPLSIKIDLYRYTVEHEALSDCSTVAEKTDLLSMDLTRIPLCKLFFWTHSLSG